MTRDEPSPLYPVRILVADDQALFVEALMSLLSDDERIEVVGHACDGVEAVELAESLLPDIVLMDHAMPRLDGIEATRQLRERLPSTCVLMLTASDSPDHMKRAAEAGAAGFLSKKCVETGLVTAILDVASLASLGSRR